MQEQLQLFLFWTGLAVVVTGNKLDFEKPWRGQSEVSVSSGNLIAFVSFIKSLFIHLLLLESSFPSGNCAPESSMGLSHLCIVFHTRARCKWLVTMFAAHL